MLNGDFVYNIKLLERLSILCSFSTSVITELPPYLMMLYCCKYNLTLVIIRNNANNIYSILNFLIILSKVFPLFTRMKLSTGGLSKHHLRQLGVSKYIIGISLILISLLLMLKTFALIFFIVFKNGTHAEWIQTYVFNNKIQNYSEVSVQALLIGVEGVLLIFQALSAKNYALLTLSVKDCYFWMITMVFLKLINRDPSNISSC